MRVVGILLFGLAGLAVIAGVALALLGIAYFDDPSGMGPIVTVLYVLGGVVLLAVAAGLVALGLAARYTGERRAAQRAAPASLPRMAEPADGRAGLWLMRAAPAVALLGILASALRTHPIAVRGNWGTGAEIAITLVGALTPLIGAAAMLAVGAGMRRTPKPARQS